MACSPHTPGAAVPSSSASPGPGGTVAASGSRFPPAGRRHRCAASLWLAVAFDAVGLSGLLSGVFFSDRAFSDLLLYAGVLGIFLSLLWWVFWYVGNLEVPAAELQDDVGLRGPPRAKRAAGRAGLGSRVRSFSRRVSNALHRPGSIAIGRVVTIYTPPPPPSLSEEAEPEEEPV